MKVTISVGGRFHAFYLAKYLHDKGYLHHLATSYPKFEVAKYGIDTTKVSTVVTKEVFERGWKKIFKTYPPNIIGCTWYDYLASWQIPLDSDVYIIWSGFALQTIQRIRKHNPSAKIIIDRGAAHILAQETLLKEINGKDTIAKNMIHRELAEYEACDYISTISKFAANSFIEQQYPKEKLFVNPMGVDLSDFALQSRTKNDLFTVGYVGVMSSQKNVVGLINAVSILVNQGAKIRLKLVGGIDYETFDEKLLTQHNFIDYIPSQPQKDLYLQYQKMDCFVLNSVQDGFGIVLLQAMSTGLPLIATTNTGGADVVKEGENGFIIPIKSDSILADKIKFLYENQEKCVEMGQNARKTVENGWTWEDYGHRYVNFLDKLTNQKV